MPRAVRPKLVDPAPAPGPEQAWAPVGRVSVPTRSADPPPCYVLSSMDRLRQDDIDRARRTPPAAKLRQALEAMASGIRLKRVALRSNHPNATEEEIEAMLRAWLER
jgi:hypothetical protein